MPKPLAQFLTSTVTFLPAGITALGTASATLDFSPDTSAVVHGLALALALCGALLGDADFYEASLRRDTLIVAHLAKRPGAHTRQIAKALGVRDAVAARSLKRLTKARLIVRETENESRALHSFRLSA
ncbi:MarR family transcriptional regulator [Streptomyces hygroscopicus]|uniref:MarR family transcriptional regulator n=1 Tax=Streptomyces hygroscopicus TaxID=1912 RepID=UPI0007671E49|nr:helix-turn-helix domain-containing protein [Streptomyces hygroscopicus]